jgi:hypothetical protein
MAAIRFGWLEARAGIGPISPRLYPQCAGFWELTKHSLPLLLDYQS